VDRLQSLLKDWLSDPESRILVLSTQSSSSSSSSSVRRLSFRVHVPLVALTLCAMFLCADLLTIDAHSDDVAAVSRVNDLPRAATMIFIFANLVPSFPAPPPLLTRPTITHRIVVQQDTGEDAAHRWQRCACRSHAHGIPTQTLAFDLVFFSRCDC
jgi:hypothetical protein